MLIDDKKYILPETNFIKFPSIKKQIVIGHTGSIGMAHFQKWLNRLNGRYKNTSAYTIALDGSIYQHFEPNFSSNILSNTEMDKKSIVILLENQGWLTKDEENNRFIDWVGYIYNKSDVVEKKWRNNTYWAKYEKEQFDNCLELVNFLCDEFFIPKIAVPHNTKMSDLDNFSGILYKSNIEKHYTDLSPAWDYENFKYKLENI